MRGPVVVVALTLVLAGCSPGSSDHATIEVDHPVSLADQAVHLKVSGLKAGESVEVGTQAVDVGGKQWHGEATFKADDHGVVDLDHASPSNGTYQSVDGMGLFWSMNPADGDPDQQAFIPPTKAGKPVEDVKVSVRKDGKTLADTALTRQWMADGVTLEPLTMANDQLTGSLVLPPPGQPKRPAVLYFGGSEGGVGALSAPGLLASHGYPVLDLAYFHAPGVPDNLRNIPLEYFASAARLLARQPGVNPAHVIVMSASRGTEAALLLAQNFPDLVHGAILYAPTAVTNASFPLPDTSAWTLHGRPIAAGDLMPVDRVNGPVLAVAGTDDQLWQSWTAAPLIVQELDKANNRYPHEALVIPQAGHTIGGPPYLPRGTSGIHPVVSRLLQYGGTRQINESALLQGWTKTLELLKSLAG
ncbi:acyl-CoA thioesterase/bile acid-CoA:amino acid N-acyltransferase family protein [Kribbella sp. VKM Ac-2568]|uniref:acyl-CoA thioesterase/bile acid-CoA:amino acid N-acyltransferase family protein n=1 Tax=Kribbella sp. VKM Ac-2568 TaxID=2512219 RepID=UPI0018EEBC48|nr:acyl-CoA thioesterase/bile acid-CoA:amino acid N-acyltransferase family protein [Kribbella sp. VKM Ac-2568]